MYDLICRKDGVEYHFRKEDGYLSLNHIETHERNAVIPSHYQGLPVEKISMYGQLPHGLLSIHIPETVKSIFNGFKNSNIRVVTGCEGLEYIYSAAFENSKLYSITLTNKLKLINDCAFLGCNELHKIGDVSGVLVIGNKAFEGTAISSFMNATNLYSIGDCAFRDCDNLTEFYVSSCLLNIGHNVFDNTSNITFHYNPNSGNVMLLRERDILNPPKTVESFQDCFEDEDIFGTEDYEIQFGWIDVGVGKLIISFFAKAKKYNNLEMFIQNVYIDNVAYAKRQLRSFSNEWEDCIFEIPLNKSSNTYHILFDIGIILPHYRRQHLFGANITIVGENYDYVIAVESISVFNPNFRYIKSDRNNTNYTVDDNNDDLYDEFDPSSWSEESYLKSKGYTVAQNVGLSERERHAILASVIDSRKMTKYQIINHLEAMINLRKYQYKYQTAIGKWEKDIEFVRNYK